MSITASDVAKLRAATGVSMLKCKKALEESNGDQEKALQILRKQGEESAGKLASRSAKEGAIVEAISSDKKKGALALLSSETDFVAGNEDFLKVAKQLAQITLDENKEAAEAKSKALIPTLIAKLGENISLNAIQVLENKDGFVASYIHSNNKIGVLIAINGEANEENIAAGRDAAMQVAAMNPDVANPEEVSNEAVEKEKEIWKDQLKKSGKPEAIFDKIMMGKEKKFREEQALTTQPFIKNNDITVGQYLTQKKLKVVKFLRLAV